MNRSAHPSTNIQKGILPSARNVPALVAVLNISQQSYFLCCVNQICFQQVSLAAQGGNWAKLLYTMAPPSTRTDSAELEANSGGTVVNSTEASTACFPRMRARYCSSPQQAAAVRSAPTSWLSAEGATEGQQLGDTRGTHLSGVASERRATAPVTAAVR